MTITMKVEAVVTEVLVEAMMEGLVQVHYRQEFHSKKWMKLLEG